MAGLTAVANRTGTTLRCAIVATLLCVIPAITVMLLRRWAMDCARAGAGVGSWAALARRIPAARRTPTAYRRMG